MYKVEDQEDSVVVLMLTLTYCRYLEEIGYTDALLDVRSSRVRSLLGIHTDKESQLKDDITQPSQSMAGDAR